MKRHYLQTASDFPQKRQLSPSPPGLAQTSALSASNNQPASTSTIIKPLVRNSGRETRPRQPYRSRACDACRALKVRCEPHPNPAVEPCHKCANLGRTCVITPRNRKRKKRTDTRVAELEARIDVLVNSLRASGDESQQGSRPGENYQARTLQGSNERDTSINRSVSPSTNKYYSHAQPGHAPTQWRHADSTPSRPVSAVDQPVSSLDTNTEHGVSDIFSDSRPDAIERGVVDVQSAKMAFQRYVSELSTILPIVIFPPQTKFEDVRFNKPILFWAIVAVSIDTIKPNIRPVLMKETYRTFGKLVFIGGQKSIEIVQALIVCCLWYRPPARIEEINVYQLVHSGVAMAMDLGLDKLAPKTKLPLRSAQESIRRYYMPNNHNAIEARRTWLGMYFLSVQVSVSLKRTFLVRWNHHMDDCVEAMETSPELLPSDAVLLHWIKLAHILEQVGIQFSIEDTTASLKLEDCRFQYSLKAYEKMLQQWREGISKIAISQIQKTLFEQSIYIVRIHMHEAALHFELDDIVSRQAEDRRLVDMKSRDRINSLITCVTSIHKALDLALSLDVECIITVPGLFMARVGYCAVNLIKLSVIASKPESHTRGIYDVADLQAEYYVEKIEERLRTAGNINGGQPFSRVAKIINTLKIWFLKPGGAKIPLDEAIAILSFPRHITSVISDLFQTTAQEQNDQDAKSSRKAHSTSKLSDSSFPWTSTRHDSLGQEDRPNPQDPPPTCPSTNINNAHYCNNECNLYHFENTAAEPIGLQTHPDMEHLYYIGALVDNGFLQMPTSIDDFMGFF
ncbi:hypothetical protein BGW36DRAFT_371154 [Talaromyces proteolyticus]|uniref:Zn(2)-C6 fungal-type domain-containing protein n=1 Tax=Talaromyces proteolyticus TaxID=1131652 RepID=A0AAD4L0G9_9EURO|nr:uncharacterized protein BGW36DRAFT_371154 [Talaromyces proteolyticus]KAH8701595.1 hypothetical protein BGW36DRAFT_371154 [Talaromyces proteolyticus]